MPLATHQEVHVQRQRLRPARLAVLLIAAIMALSGCKDSAYGDRKGTPLGQPAKAADVAPQAAAPAPAPQPAGAPGADPAQAPAAAPAQAPAAQGSRPFCPLDRKVIDPGADTPEGTLARLYRAALGPDDEASFEAFAAEFASRHERGWIKEQYWPRMRRYVSKYVTSEDPITFHICREERKSSDHVKFFVRSFDTSKTDPPIALARVGSVWKVDFFTP